MAPRPSKKTSQSRNEVGIEPKPSKKTSQAEITHESSAFELESDGRKSHTDETDGELLLDRKRLLERIYMEFQIERLAPSFMNFVLLLVCVLTCMATYDPLGDIANIHENLRRRFLIQDARECNTHEDIMEYINSFTHTAYKMAPALVDANTLDSIDYARCTDSNVDDICILRYWLTEPQLRDSNNRQVLDDVLSAKNAFPSVVDCPSESDSPCVDRKHQVNESLRHKTLGLLPEDPIILQSRLDYPISSIVILTPIVWQTRAKRKECSGFGDKYNIDVLGAGRCTMEDNCNPKSVTAFDGPRPAKTTARKQTFFLTYSEDVFFCVDRNDLSDVFYDRSWHPWASFQDITEGKKIEARDLQGEPVFYKFISDVAYLQSPIVDTLHVPDVPPTCNNTKGLYYDYYSGTDPMIDSSHALWREDEHNQIYFGDCSLRKFWANQFLSRSIPERANSFITLETTQLTISTLVITPQTKDYADVQTLLRVTWEIDQFGTISTNVFIQSTSQTQLLWYVWVVLVVVFGVAEIVQGVGQIRRSRDLNRTQQQRRKAMRDGAFDVLVATSAITLVATNVVLELRPPNVADSLLNALTENVQESYFEVFKSIIEYNNSIFNMRQFGFFVICLMFVRFVNYLSLHPRMAVLLNTLYGIADDLYHFVLYFSCIFLILTFLAWWMFAEKNSEHFGTFSSTFYSQFRMFTGDFVVFPDDVPPYSLYIWLFLYIIVVFVILMNFLLAIVVDVYTSVTQANEDMVTEQNVTIDIIDIVITWFRRRRRQFPNTISVLHALNDHALGDSVDAINFYNHKPSLFLSAEHAYDFLDFYANKLRDSQGNRLLTRAKEEGSGDTHANGSEMFGVLEHLEKNVSDLGAQNNQVGAKMDHVLRQQHALMVQVATLQASKVQGASASTSSAKQDESRPGGCEQDIETIAKDKGVPRTAISNLQQLIPGPYSPSQLHKPALIEDLLEGAAHINKGSSMKEDRVAGASVPTSIGIPLDDTPTLR